MTTDTWDASVTIDTHVVRHIDIYDGEPYWHTFTRQHDGTYEESFELIEIDP